VKLHSRGLAACNYSYPYLSLVTIVKSLTGHKSGQS